MNVVYARGHCHHRAGARSILDDPCELETEMRDLLIVRRANPKLVQHWFPLRKVHLSQEVPGGVRAGGDEWPRVYHIDDLPPSWQSVGSGAITVGRVTLPTALVVDRLVDELLAVGQL